MLLGTSLPLPHATARVPFWLSTETWGPGMSWFLQRHLGDTVRNSSVVSRPELGCPDGPIMPWEFFRGINTNWGMPALCTDYHLTKHVRSPSRCWMFSSLSSISVSSNGISAIHFLLAGFTFSILNFVSSLLHGIFLTTYNTATIKV